MSKICSLKSVNNKERNGEINGGNCPGFAGGKCINKKALAPLSPQQGPLDIVTV
jgi:hypothetical protein